MLPVPAAMIQTSALASSLRLIPQWHAFPGPEEEGDGTRDSDTVSQGYFNDPKATAGQHLFSSRSGRVSQVVGTPAMPASHVLQDWTRN